MTNATQTLLYPAIPVFWSGTHANSKKPLWTDEDVATIFSSTIKRNDPVTPFVGDHTANDLPVIGLADGTQYKLLRNKSLNRLEIWATPTTFSDEALQAYKDAGYKRPSVKLRKDLSIKNIALVQNPAIKDIPEITFSADLTDNEETKVIQPENDYNRAEELTFGDWRLPKVGRILNNIRDYFIETLGKEKADALVSRDDLENLDSYEPEVPTWVTNDINRLYEKIWNLESTMENHPTVSTIFSENTMGNPTNATPQEVVPVATPPAPTNTEYVFSAEDMQRALQKQQAEIAAENAAQAARMQALERRAKEQDVELIFSSDEFRDRITPALRPIAKRLLVDEYDQNGEYTFSADNGATVKSSRQADIKALLAHLPRLNTRENANNGVHQFSADETTEIDNLAKRTSGRA